MNKEGFNKLVSDYSDVKNKFNELEKLVQQYPYSQPLRMLNVKSSSSQEKVEFQKRLGLAAFYSTDRNVLRSLIETGQVPSDITAPVKKIPVRRSTTTPTKRTSLPKATRVKKNETVDIDLLRGEVLHNLDELMKSKAHFWELVDEEAPKKSVKPNKKKVEDESTPIKKASSSNSNTSKPVTKTASKSVKSKPIVKTGVSRKTRKNQLIDKFIADTPSITPNKTAPDNQSDLSKASSELKEDLVSENLAIIFASQGKTSKAIDIYKKLIWKFPQKKASFASRIEELKKK